jgi:hypothetical protein
MLQAQEICDNGVDDDADGLIDLNDTTDCACGIAPVQLEGILQNPSFEEYDCMPTSYSQLDCADTWSQATYSTSDYFLNPSYMPPWIEQPLPGGGHGCVGGYFCDDYMEYIGGCLTQPMLAGTSYSLNLSIAAFKIDNFLYTTTAMDLSPVNVTVYGLSICPTWPTNVSLCPGNEGWTELGYVTYTPSNSWSGITITFVPTFDVQAIIIGSPCTLPPDYPHVFDPWLAYFIMDEFWVGTPGTAGASITSEGNWCDGDLVITAHPDSTMTGYQWYQAGIAIPDASDTVLAVSALSLDSGDYVFRVVGDTSCATSTFHADTQIEPPPYIALTVDGLWCPLSGTYQWFLNGNLIPGATDAYYLPTENGIYTVELTNAQGCSTLSYPFDWLTTAIAPSSGAGITLAFSPEDATLRVRGAQGRSVLTVSDASGRVIICTELNNPDHICSLAKAAHGVYLARISDRLFRFVR